MQGGLPGVATAGGAVSGVDQKNDSPRNSLLLNENAYATVSLTVPLVRRGTANAEV